MNLSPLCVFSFTRTAEESLGILFLWFIPRKTQSRQQNLCSWLSWILLCLCESCVYACVITARGQPGQVTGHDSWPVERSLEASWSPPHHHHHHLTVFLSGWPVFTSFRRRLSLCWERGCYRGTVTGSALEPRPGLLSFALCLCMSLHVCASSQCVDSDFLCAAVRGSRNGAEMTLDPDHMSLCIGWSPTLPPAGLFAPLSGPEISPSSSAM